MKRKSTLTWAALVTVLGITMVAGARRAWAPGRSTSRLEPIAVPIRLAIARRTPDGDVDVVRYDGTDWITLVPTSTLSAQTDGGRTYDPEIEALVLDDELSMIGLGVRYCTPSLQEVENCGAPVGYVYDTASARLVPLGAAGSVLPLAWLDNGLLIVEDLLAGRALLYQPSDGSTRPIPGFHTANGSSALPQSVAPGDVSVAVSAAASQAFLRLATPGAGTAVAIPGTPSPYGSPWMAFDSGGDDFALVRLRDGGDNVIGAGELQLLHRSDAGWSLPTPVTDSADHLDFSPAWAAGGGRIAFLRAAASPWRSGTVTASDALQAGLMVYDRQTATTSSLLAQDRLRRQLIVPGGETVAALLEDDAGSLHVKLVDLETARTRWAVPDQGRTAHTAVAAPRE